MTVRSRGRGIRSQQLESFKSQIEAMAQVEMNIEQRSGARNFLTRILQRMDCTLQQI